MKVTGESISQHIGFSREIVESRDVAVEALMNTEEAEEVGRGREGRSAALAFPEGGVKVVTFTKDGPFTNVKRLSNSFQL